MQHIIYSLRILTHPSLLLNLTKKSKYQNRTTNASTADPDQTA